MQTWVAWDYEGDTYNNGTTCPLECEAVMLAEDLALRIVPRNRRTLDLPIGTSFLQAEAAFGIGQPINK